MTDDSMTRKIRETGLSLIVSDDLSLSIETPEGIFPLGGWAAGDTSTNTPLITGYDTGSKVTGISVNAPAGAVNEYTHDAPSHLPPYIVVYMWKRTA